MNQGGGRGSVRAVMEGCVHRGVDEATPSGMEGCVRSGCDGAQPPRTGSVHGRSALGFENRFEAIERFRP